jgi:tetratricopeptide (TPR) repeat protein
MRIDPQSGNVRHELAKALLESGDVNEAVKLYEQLLPPLPDDLNEPRGVDTSRPDYPTLMELYVNATVNYGIALARQGRYAEAARRFKEALRLAPEAEMIREELEKAERRAADN